MNEMIGVCSTYGGGIIIRWILMKWVGGAWTGLIWLRLGPGGGLF